MPSPRNKTPKKVPRGPKRKVLQKDQGGLSHLLVILGWVLASVGLLTYPHFQTLLIGHPFPFNLPLSGLILVGVVIMFLGVKGSGERPFGPDLPRTWTWLLFLLLAGLTLYLRLDDAYRLPAFSIEDHFYVISEERNVLDYSGYHILFPPDYRAPFFVYLASFVWVLLPKATGIFVIRLAATLMDLAAAWLAYLAGKEVGGRRMGLILMAMMAASKTSIEVDKFDLGINSVVMAGALITLFLFRAMKRPNLKHFLQLGLSIGFADWTYTAIRAWIPTVAVGILLWVFWGRERRPRTPFGWALATGTALAWSVLFFFQNTSFFHQSGIVKFLFQGWGCSLVIGGLGYCYYRVWDQRKKERSVFEVISGLFLAVLVLLPLWVNPFYSFESNIHLSNQELWGSAYHFGFLDILKKVGENLHNALTFLFVPSGGLGGHPFFNNRDCFIDYFVPVFGILGVVSAFAKPDWKKTAMLVLFVSGVIPGILTPEVYWSHVLGTIVPCIVMAGWGAFLLWESFRRIGRSGSFLGFLVMTLLAAGFTIRDSQWIDQWENQRSADLSSADLVRDELKGDRVYLAPSPGNFVLNIQELMCDGQDVHLMGASNPIDLAPEEKGKDLAVIVYSGDLLAQEKLKKEFPAGIWGEKKNYRGIVELKWVVVPFKDLSVDPQALFFVRRDPQAKWKRQYFWCYGVGRGLIRYEDRKAHWNDDLPAAAQGNNTVRVTGDWKVDKSGHFTMEVQTSNILQLFIDGKRVLDIKKGQGDKVRKRRIQLDTGTHQVEVRSALIQEIKTPVIWVESDEGGWKKPLDDLGS